MDKPIIKRSPILQAKFDAIMAQYTDDDSAHFTNEEVPHIFSTMRPLPEAIESFNLLATRYEVYILSTAPWKNPTAWSDKLNWVKRYLGENGYKRLILTHHKNLNKGAYLIDDRTKNGASDFEGELLLFGSEQYPNWHSVVTYLMNK